MAMNSKPSFAIGIPTINQYDDFFKKSLESYSAAFPDTDIFIVDNGNQGIEPNNNISVSIMNKNIGVAASWNFLLRVIYIKGYSHALILNDDILLGRSSGEIQQLCDKLNWADLFVSSNYGMCAFMMPEKTIKNIGYFDNNFFPAYYEDNDMLYRLKLKSLSVVKTSVLDPFVFRRSKSVEKDPKLNQKYLQNRDYYVKKWGGIPDQEKYSSPFNSSEYVHPVL